MFLCFTVAKSVEAGIEKNVFVTTQFRVESHSQLDQWRDATSSRYLSCTWKEYASYDLQ